MPKLTVIEGGGEFRLIETPSLTLINGGKMSIEVTRHQFVDKNTQEALSKIYNCGEYEDPGYANQIGLTISELAEAAKKNEQTYLEKYLPYVEKDDKDQPVFETNEKGEKLGYKVKADFRKEALEIDQALGQSSFSVPGRHKLYVSKLKGAKLSPKDFTFINFLVDDTR